MSDLSKSNMTLPEDRIKQLEAENAKLKEAIDRAFKYDMHPGAVEMLSSALKGLAHE